MKDGVEPEEMKIIVVTREQAGSASVGNKLDCLGHHEDEVLTRDNLSR